MNDSTKHPTIGILGPFGYGNLGDAAIQQSMIQHIYKFCPDAEIIGFSMNPRDTEARHNIKTFPLTRVLDDDFTNDESNRKKNLIKKFSRWLKYNPNFIIRKIEQILVRIPTEFVLIYHAYHNLQGLDMLIISGGGQLDDLWGGPWKHPYALFKFTLLAKLQRIKVIIVSVGFESARTSVGKFFIKNTIDRASYRSYRDLFSKLELARLGLDTRDESLVYPDLAHSLDVKDSPSTRTFDYSAPVVGLNIVSYYDPRFWPLKDQKIYQQYLSKMVLFMEWLINNHYKIILIRSDINLDMHAIADALQLLREKGIKISPGQIVEPDIQTVDDLIENLLKTDFVVASRLHTLLLAVRVYKPVIALSFQSKITNVMNDMGLSQYCLPISDFATDTLEDKLLSSQADCSKITDQIIKRSLAYRASLEEQYEHIFKLINK